MADNHEKNNSSLSFEDFRNDNGITYWWASDLMQMLGYKDMKAFQRVVDRATKAFVSLNIPYYENIIPEMHDIAGQLTQDFKLTRFACYITVMNGDPKREEVAQAQAYFAQQTRKFELYIQDHNEIDRLLIREELTEGTKSLMSTAKQAGVMNYPYFQDAGYRGLYNMPSWQLKKKRNLDEKSNGLSYLTDKMNGQDLFAHVNLVKGERSYLAELASHLL